MEQAKTSINLPQEMVTTLDKIAKDYGLSRSDIIRIACSQFLSGQRIVGFSELPRPTDGTPVPVIITDAEK